MGNFRGRSKSIRKNSKEDDTENDVSESSSNLSAIMQDLLNKYLKRTRRLSDAKDDSLTLDEIRKNIEIIKNVNCTF